MSNIGNDQSALSRSANTRSLCARHISDLNPKHKDKHTSFQLLLSSGQ